jgi:AraC-like DNA-binding protein/ligand-binding sensor protein
VKNELIDLSQRLSESEIYHDYERAFSEATGLPLAFRSTTDAAPAFRKSRFANPFCLHLAETEPGCQLCVEMQERLSCGDSGATKTGSCLAGLTDSAVPVKLGEKTIGFLTTGQVALTRPSRTQFRQIVEWLSKGGAKTDLEALEKSYFETRVVSRKQYEAMVRLLEVFSKHLSIAAERIAITESQAEPPMIQRARQFIEEKHEEDIGLNDAAQAVHASTFHFCKMFKKATGMTFTEYLAFVRVGKAKQLLLNPNARVSEVAYEVGFNSLTHFNRSFRKLTGKSPTAFRTEFQN